MATFSERKIQRIMDSFRDLNPDELSQVQSRLQTYEPEKRNAKCGLLKLPAEIRNIIYQYVAADAHASAAAPNRAEVLDCKNTKAVQDQDGRKIRPGLLGACREIFKEFHGIFYSPIYIKAKIFQKHTEWQTVTNAAMLDAIVNRKHNVSASSYSRSLSELEADIAMETKHNIKLDGGREIIRSDGSTAFMYFIMFLSTPWIDDFDQITSEWSMSRSCLGLACARRVPDKKNRCALCLVSMGPERAASEMNYYH